MWILQLLPDAVILWFVNILLALGVAATVAGWFLHRIPVLYQYQLPFRIAGVVLLVLGVYLRGGYAIEQEWRARVAELELKVAQAEKQSAQSNVQIQERVVNRTRVIRERGDDIIRYVDREVVKKEEVIRYIEQCPVPREIIDAHNAAAEMNRAARGPK